MDPRYVFTCSDLLVSANDSLVIRRGLLRLRSWLDLMNGFPRSISITGGIEGYGEHLLTGVGYFGAFSDAGMILSKQSDELSLLPASYRRQLTVLAPIAFKHGTLAGIPPLPENGSHVVRIFHTFFKEYRRPLGLYHVEEFLDENFHPLSFFTIGQTLSL